MIRRILQVQILSAVGILAVTFEFKVNSQEQKCFSEYFQQNTTIIGEVFSLNTNNKLSVLDYNGQVIQQKNEKSQQKKFNFTTDQICVENYDQNPQQIKVNFQQKILNTQKVQKDDIQPFDVSILLIEENLLMVKQQNDLSIKQSNYYDYGSINSNLTFMSKIYIIWMIFMALTQTYFYRHIFLRKKII